MSEFGFFYVRRFFFLIFGWITAEWIHSRLLVKHLLLFLVAHLLGVLASDLHGTIFAYDDIQPSIHGRLGGLHLDELRLPEFAFFLFIGGLKGELPVLDFCEFRLQESIPCLSQLDLDLLDGFLGHAARNGFLSRTSEFTACLHADACRVDT